LGGGVDCRKRLENSMIRRVWRPAISSGQEAEFGEIWYLGGPSTNCLLRIELNDATVKTGPIGSTEKSILARHFP